MPVAAQPSVPPPDLAPPADVDTLVEAGLLPEQPVPSSDPPADPPPDDDSPADTQT